MKYLTAIKEHFCKNGHFHNSRKLAKHCSDTGEYWNLWETPSID